MMEKPNNENGWRFFHVFDGWKRWQFLLFISLVVIPLFYWVFNPQPSVLDDNFHYMNLAQQLYEGKGYTVPYSPEAVPETQVAPGFPFILSLIMRITGSSKPVLALKIFNNLCFWLALIIIAFIFDRYLKVNRWITVLFSVFLVFNTDISMYASMVTTEAPFILFSMLTVLSFLAYGEKKRLGYFLLACLFTVMALYIRIPGAPLAIAGFAWLLYRKDYKKAIIYAAVVGILVGIWLGPLILSGKWTYLGQVGKSGLDTSKGGRYSSHIARYLHHLLSYLLIFIPDLFMPHHGPFLYIGSEIGIFSWLGFVVGIPLTILMVWGTVRTIKDKGKDIVPIYTVFYFLISSFFGSYGTRYTTYLFPFVFYLVVVGFVAFLDWTKLRRGWRNVIFIVAMFLVVVFEGLPKYLMDVQLTSKARGYFREYGEAYTELAPLHRYKAEPSIQKMHTALRWCQKNIPEGEVILASQYRTAHFLTEHTTVCPLYLLKYFKAGYRGFTTDQSVAEIDSLSEWMLANKVTYIVLDPIYNITSYFIKPAISRYQKCYSELYRTEPPASIVFEVDTFCLRKSIKNGNKDYVEFFKRLYSLNASGNKSEFDSLVAAHGRSEDDIKMICRTHSYLMDLKKTEEAQIFFDGAVLMYPDNATLWLNRGIDLNQAGMNDLSIIALEKAKSLGADPGDCYNNIATAYANMKDYDKAREYFQKAFEVVPDDPVIVRNLLTVQLLEKDYEGAMKRVKEELARTDVDSTYKAEIISFHKQYLKWRESQPNRAELPE